MFHCSLQVLCFIGVFGLVISQVKSLPDTGQIPTTDIRYLKNNSKPVHQPSQSDINSTNAGTPSTRHMHSAGTLKDKDDLNQGIKHQPSLKLFTLPPKTTSIPLISRHNPSIKVFTSSRNSTSMETSTPPTEYDFTEMSIQASVHEVHSISSNNTSETNDGQNVTSSPTYDSPNLVPLHKSLDDEIIINIIPSEPTSEPDPIDFITEDEKNPGLMTSVTSSEPEPNPGSHSDNKETNESLSLHNNTFITFGSFKVKTNTPAKINSPGSNLAANNSEANITDFSPRKQFSLHALLKSNLYYGTFKPRHTTSKPKLSTLVRTIKPFYTTFNLDPKFFQATTPIYEFDNLTKLSSTPKPEIVDETTNFLTREKTQVVDYKENSVLGTPKFFKNETSTVISNTSIIPDLDFSDSSQDHIILDSEFAESSQDLVHVIPKYIQFSPIKTHSQEFLPEKYLNKSSHTDNYSNKYNSNYYNEKSNSLYNGASVDPISLQSIPASPSYKSYGDQRASNKYVKRPRVNVRKIMKSHKYDPDHHVNEYKSRPFSFEYQVKDKQMGTDFSHREKSDGRVTAGKYSVLLPDGRRQVVSFTADHLHYGGYQATVEYEKYTPKYKDMIITTNKSVEIHTYKDTSSTSLNEVDSFDYNKEIPENKNEVTPTPLLAPAPVSILPPSSNLTSYYTSSTPSKTVPSYDSTPIPTPEPISTTTFKAALTLATEPIPTSEPIPSTTSTYEPEPISAPAPVALYAPAPITPAVLALYQNNSTEEHVTTAPSYNGNIYFSLNPDDTYSSAKNYDSQFHEEELDEPYHKDDPTTTLHAATDFWSSLSQHNHNGYSSDKSTTKSSKIWDVRPYRIVGNIGWDEVFKT